MSSCASMGRIRFLQLNFQIYLFDSRSWRGKYVVEPADAPPPYLTFDSTSGAVHYLYIPT
jgi:hypothetical protein